MEQLDLSPWLPGPLSEHIIETFHMCAPDVTENNMDAVKLLAAQIINTCLGVYIPDFPKPKPASMYLVLVGPPRSGKGTLMKIALAFYAGVSAAMEREIGRGIKIVGSATAEGLRQELATARLRKKRWEHLGPQGRVIQIWERVTPPRGSEFYSSMAEILDGAWDSTDLSKSRVTEGLPVKVEADSYYFSLLWDCHPERWREVLASIGGTYGSTRRLLPVPVQGELSAFGREEEMSRVIGILPRRVAEFASMIRPLFGKSILVELPPLRQLGDEVRRLDLESDERGLVEDYTRRLLAAWAVDACFPLVMQVIHRREVCISTSLSMEGDTSITDSNNCITKITTITRNNLNNFDDLVIVLKCSSMNGYVQKITGHNQHNLQMHRKLLTVGRVWVQILHGMLRGQVKIDEEVIARYRAKLEEFWAERRRRGKPPYAVKKEVWHSVFHGMVKNKLKPIFETLAELGYMVVRRVGRATYVFDPSARLCGTCAWFNTKACPFKGYTDIGDSPEDHQCDKYTPVGEEDQSISLGDLATG